LVGKTLSVIGLAVTRNASVFSNDRSRPNASLEDYLSSIEKDAQMSGIGFLSRFFKFRCRLAELKADLPALRPVLADNGWTNAASIEYQTQNGTAVRVHTHF
jgi:hypothetical protein